ncbi:unnamed protein product [Oikopleura dioica]|uniref:Uncharacterized protein n=1 Tax=Oikopleura dioica TaxID=34765 RepID=E4XUX6_OIKDI|nr:unnamed protein product [Oikopleura dioica]
MKLLIGIIASALEMICVMFLITWDLILIS